MTLHRDVTERSKNIQEINLGLKAKVRDAKVQQETSTKGLQAFKLRCEEQLASLEKAYQDLCTQHQSTLDKIEGVRAETAAERDSEIQKIFDHGRRILEQKASVVVNFKDELRRTSEHFNKVSEMQTIG